MNNNNYNLHALVDQLEQQLRDYLQARQIDNPLVVGIHTSGVWLAKELHRRLGVQEALGELNASFYRDDFDRSGIPSQTQPSRLPATLADRHIVLVDDVLHTGRTVRAAMNELFDYGRIASITLSVLVSRGGRELPIEAQVVALHEEPGSELVYRIPSMDAEYIELVKK